ncbi:FMN-dependent NADH-azoreductase [Arenibacterium sp. LLYu02]|uniref:FMN-dependent NADH-azoreductase n=1 Tax=Arenibacterium sp. LLYu02 TaxID=3404132 RepID=UPI003B214540
MTKILYISASPRGAASQSGKLAEAYLAARSRQAPDVTIDRLDLWRADLPEFDGDKAAAKMTFFGVGDMDAPRQSAWDQVVAITSRFLAADEYVLSVPMWNGGIPYKLKHYIDIITQPGLLFGFDPEAAIRGFCSIRPRGCFLPQGSMPPARLRNTGRTIIRPT